LLIGVLMNREKHLLKIHVYELKIGMFVAQLDIPWEKSPFLLQGFDIKSPADISAVQQVCDYVYIDTSRQKDTHGAVSNELSAKFSQSFEGAFGAAKNTYQSTSNLVKSVMDDIRFGNQLNVNAVKSLVSDCVDRVLENPDAMMLLTQLKNKDEYTSQHSLNVSIMSILLGRHLNYSVEDLNKLGLSGLLHDMGKMKIPLEILNKEGNLTPDEFKVMRTHATHGRDILMSAREIYPGAIDVAHMHHEKLDGTGYPRGIMATGISQFVRIVAIADVYDAITSDRVYQKGRLHLEAINTLTHNRKTHFDADLVIKFIDCIGIYPVGNPVEMTNGEVGVVIAGNSKQKTKPKVMMLLNADKIEHEALIIDLADPACVDSKGEAYRIYKVLHQNQYGLNLRDYFNDGKFLSAN